MSAFELLSVAVVVLPVFALLLWDALRTPKKRGSR